MMLSQISYDRDTLWLKHLMIETSYHRDILWSRHSLKMALRVPKSKFWDNFSIQTITHIFGPSWILIEWLFLELWKRWKMWTHGKSTDKSDRSWKSRPVDANNSIYFAAEKKGNWNSLQLWKLKWMWKWRENDFGMNECGKLHIWLLATSLSKVNIFDADRACVYIRPPLDNGCSVVGWVKSAEVCPH